ncbi:MAG: SNF2-related protein [Myxococcota bacterium]
MKRLLVERALDAVTGDDLAHRAMREYLGAALEAAPGARLAAAGRGPDLDDVEGHVGWVVRPPDSLVPSRIMPKKGGGLKSRTLQAAEHAQLEQRGHAHAIAMTLVARESRYHFSEHAQMTLQGLAVLAGQAGVYLRRTRDLVPVTVVADSPRVEVIPGDDGAGARLVVRWGDGSDGTDDTVVGRMSPPHAGHWVMRVDEQHLKVYVGRWSAAAVRVWRSLSGDAPAIPEEAAPELAETLLGLAGHVAVKKDASWLGDALVRPGRGLPAALRGPARREGARRRRSRAAGGRARRAGAVRWRQRHPGAARRAHRPRGARQRGRGRGHPRRRAHGRAGGRAERLRLARRGPRAGRRGVERARACAARTTCCWRSSGAGTGPRIHRATASTSCGCASVCARTGSTSPAAMLDGAELLLRALLAALRDGKRFVALDDERVIEINQALARELAPLTALGRAPRASEAGGRRGRGLRASALAAPLVAELQAAGATVDGPPEWLSAASKLDEAAALAVEVPPELVADLRPYQKEGLSWLARLAHWARGACLADDMGLGKTLQALAFLLLRAPVGRALVVAPTSVVSNRLREAERFAPTLGVVPTRAARTSRWWTATRRVIVTS